MDTEIIKWIIGRDNTVPNIKLRDKTISELLYEYHETYIGEIPYSNILDSVWSFIRAHPPHIKKQLIISMVIKLNTAKGKTLQAKAASLLELIN